MDHPSDCPLGWSAEVVASEDIDATRPRERPVGGGCAGTKLDDSAASEIDVARRLAVYVRDVEEPLQARFVRSGKATAARQTHEGIGVVDLVPVRGAQWCSTLRAEQCQSESAASTPGAA